MVRHYLLACVLVLSTVNDAFAGRGDILREFTPNPTANGRGIAFDGVHLWYTIQSDTNIYQIDVYGVPSGVVLNIGVMIFSLAWDGTNLWCGDDARFIYCVDVATNSIVRSFQVPPGDTDSPYLGGLTYDSKRNTLWYAILTERRAFQIDLFGNPISDFEFPSPNGVFFGMAYDSTSDTLWIGEISVLGGSNAQTQVDVNGNVHSVICQPFHTPLGACLDPVSFPGEVAIWTIDGFPTFGSPPPLIRATSVSGFHWGEMVSICQVDYKFANLDWPNSDTARMDVNVAKLKEATGIYSGFVNVATHEGWVVQNLPIMDSFPYTVIATYFDLGSFSTYDVRQLYASFSFTQDPLDSYSLSGRQCLAVDSCVVNAEGADSFLSGEPPEPPLPDGLPFKKGMKVMYHHVQPDHVNVQCAHMQCVPMAAANGLQWLEDFYGVKTVDIPNDHVLGYRNDKPNKSLVGKLDVFMKRGDESITREKGGGGTTPNNRVNGLHSYLESRKLPLNLIHKFNQGTPNNTKVEVLHHIRDMIRANAAVEVFLDFKDRRYNTTGGHSVCAVGVGAIGIPPKEGKKNWTNKIWWIDYVHDEEQTNTDTKDERGTTNEDGTVKVFHSYLTWSVTLPLTMEQFFIKNSVERAMAVELKGVRHQK